MVENYFNNMYKDGRCHLKSKVFQLLEVGKAAQGIQGPQNL